MLILLRIFPPCTRLRSKNHNIFIRTHFIVFAQEGEQKKVSNTHNNNKFILALDDDFDIVTLVKFTLQKHGFSVFAFTDPLVALEHFNLNLKDYNIVISDMRMPGMNGNEFVKKVKEIKSEVKVILMSAFEITDREFHQVLQSVTIDAFLQKPFSIKQLEHLIEQQLN
jgi:DNA-binding NtrC family response regulator